MLLQDIRCDDEKPSDHDWVLVHYYLSVHTWDVDDDQGSAERRYDSALDLEGPFSFGLRPSFTAIVPV